MLEMENTEISELHDGIVTALHVDFVKRTATLRIMYYRDGSSSTTRTAAEISFENVESVSSIASLDRLEKNALAGNVNYWVPTKSFGTSHIYLVDGYIAIISNPPRTIHLSQ